MNLPKLAVGRPVTTLMVLVSVLVIGGVAWNRLPLAFLPEVDAPFIGVEVPYPNSNPTQIEKEITKPVEEALSTLSGIKKLRSRSTADEAQVNMEFDWGKDLDVVRMQVSEKMEQIKPTLPAGIGQVLIFSFSTSDIPVVEGRVAAKGVNLSKNYDLLETRIANRIRRVPGVARVDLEGVAPREISIDLELDKVKEHNVDLGALIARLQGASENLVLGQVDSGGLRYTARALGAFGSVEAIADLPVDDRGLRLRDIAEIVYEEPPSGIGRHLEGEYAVAVTVYKESTANTVETAHAVHKVIQEDIDKDPLLKGVQLFVFEDQAKQITDGIEGLTHSGMIGGLLAVLVLYFFLRRLDSTLIVALSIPFSVIAACGVMYFTGMTLNILSMMGLMLGVGMLVDNAIVVLESIDRSQREERDAKKAALTGASHVWLAVTTSTCTTLIVFLPLIVGAKNQLTVFLKEVGISLSFAMVASLFSSLTLIPLASAHYLKARKPKPVKSVIWLEDRYARVLGWTLRHRIATFLLVIVGLVSGFVPFMLKLVPTGMFSANTNERLHINYEFADFSYKSDSEKAVNQVEKFINANRKQFLVEELYSYFRENEAGTIITLAKKDLTDPEMQELRTKLRTGLPKIPGVKLSFDDDSAEAGGSSTFFAVKFFGQDSEVLNRLAEEAERRLATVNGVEDITSPIHQGRREIQVKVDRDKAMRLGMTAQDISDLFSFTLGGMRLRRFNAGDHEVETWLSLRQEDRTSLEDLKRIQVTNEAGTPVLLADIASFNVVTREQEIQRENRKVKTEVRAVYEGKKWDKSKERIAALMDAFDMPPGYSWSWDDRILEQDGQGQQMGVNFLLALVLVYLVMASLFESLAQPFAILFAIPFAFPGAIWLLAATRTPFNMMAQIGLLLLMGVVVTNGIVLLDHLNQLRKAGMPRDEAIIQAGRDRLRPVLMTAATTILGLLPLAWGGAAVGDLFYYPLARTVMGGLVSSTILTLLVLPFINLGVEGLANWMRSLWVGSTVKAAAPAAVPVEPAEA